ncbi:MAG: ribulose-phosphate 3-epimerase [Lentisphaeria bacterium]|nr:ribulose-phosphate 3-epimerase [Lentisphaeria bacterium]
MQRRPLTALPADKVLVAPSILAADFGRLAEEISGVEAAGAELLHIDVMDGHFVPNLSIGPPVVQSIRTVSALPFDVHLMLADPGRYAEAFIAAGADHITIHVESEGDLAAILEQIRSSGCSSGITLRPGTPASALDPYLNLVDMVLVMTVEPGFGGQSFMADQIPKIRHIARALEELDHPVHLEVDGGLDAQTAPLVVEAGANVLVAGSSVFRNPAGISEAVRRLRS